MALIRDISTGGIFFYSDFAPKLGADIRVEFSVNIAGKRLQFELTCIVANLNYAGPVKSDLHFTILRRFREAGVVIPYPQREVRITREGPGAAQAPASPA